MMMIMMDSLSNLRRGGRNRTLHKGRSGREKAVLYSKFDEKNNPAILVINVTRRKNYERYTLDS